MAKEIAREIGNRSREFYEFVLPPVDMHIDDNSLVIQIDMPGFDKKDIKLSIHKNILSINAQKPESKAEMIVAAEDDRLCRGHGRIPNSLL